MTAPEPTITTFKMRLPEVKPGKLREWRGHVARDLNKRKRKKAGTFSKHVRLAAKVRLYLPPTTWHKIDVDNTLKALMDALQGAIEGHGRKDYSGSRVIPEDNQVYEAHIVKRPAGAKKVGGVVTLTVIPGKHKTVRYANESPE
jgi:Holliday junction resolvase RusA-like endonuclease